MRRSDQVAARIAGMIASGQTQPGTRLPSERSLAADLGCSRNCVREALRSLAEQKIVETRRGDGTYIARPRPETPAQALSEAAARREKPAQVFELRRILESGVAALAAARATRRDLDALKALVLSQEHETSFPKQAAWDARFHERLAKAAKNPVLSEALHLLAPLLAESRSPDLLSPRRGRRSVAGHLRIVNALAAGDPAAARAAMETHLAEAEDAALRPDLP